MQRIKSDNKFAGGVINLEDISESQGNILSTYINTYNLQPGHILKKEKYFFCVRNKDGVDQCYDFELTQNVTIAGTLNFTDTSAANQEVRDYFFNKAKIDRVLPSGYYYAYQDRLYYNLHTIQAIDEFGCNKFQVIDTSPNGKLGEGAYAKVGKVIGVWKYSMFDETDFQYYPKEARWIGKVNYLSKKPELEMLSGSEFKLLSALNPFSTKNIFTYRKHDKSSSVLTTEFFRGINLDKLLNTMKDDKRVYLVSPYQRFSLSIHASRNVCRLRKHNIMHRDIKPDNFIVDLHPNGDFTYTKLIDLNLSVHMSKPISSSVAVGSPLYSAPEIFRGEGHNSKSDIFSLGLTIAEIWNDVSLDRYINNCKKLGYDRYIRSFMMERATQQVLSFDMFEDIKFSDDYITQRDNENFILAIVAKLANYYELSRMDPQEAIERFEKLRLKFYKELHKVDAAEAPVIDAMHEEAVNFANYLMNEIHANNCIEDQARILEARLIQCINAIVSAPRLFVDVVGLKLLADCHTKAEILNVATNTFKQFNQALLSFKEKHLSLLSIAINDNNYPAMKLKNQFMALNAKLITCALDIDDMSYLTNKMQSLLRKLEKVPELNEQIRRPLCAI